MWVKWIGNESEREDPCTYATLHETEKTDEEATTDLFMKMHNGRHPAED